MAYMFPGSAAPAVADLVRAKPTISMLIRQHKRKAPLRLYQRCNELYPKLTKAATGGVLGGLGDFAAQCLTIDPREERGMNSSDGGMSTTVGSGSMNSSLRADFMAVLHVPGESSSGGVARRGSEEETATSSTVEVGETAKIVDSIVSQVDWRRTFAFFLFGFAYNGTAAHWFYSWLELSHMTVVQKLFVSNTVFYPAVYFPSFYTTLGMLGRGDSLEKCVETTCRETPNALVACWSYMIPVNTIQFLFVPPQLQIAYLSAANFLWNMALSLMSDPSRDPVLLADLSSPPDVLLRPDIRSDPEAPIPSTSGCASLDREVGTDSSTDTCETRAGGEPRRDWTVEEQTAAGSTYSCRGADRETSSGGQPAPVEELTGGAFKSGSSTGGVTGSGESYEGQRQQSKSWGRAAAAFLRRYSASSSNDVLFSRSASDFRASRDRPTFDEAAGRKTSQMEVARDSLGGQQADTNRSTSQYFASSSSAAKNVAALQRGNTQNSPAEGSMLQRSGSWQGDEDAYAVPRTAVLDSGFVLEYNSIHRRDRSASRGCLSQLDFGTETNEDSAVNAIGDAQLDCGTERNEDFRTVNAIGDAVISAQVVTLAASLALGEKDDSKPSDPALNKGHSQENTGSTTATGRTGLDDLNWVSTRTSKASVFSLSGEAEVLEANAVCSEERMGDIQNGESQNVCQQVVEVIDESERAPEGTEEIYYADFPSSKSAVLDQLRFRFGDSPHGWRLADGEDHEDASMSR